MENVEDDMLLHGLRSPLGAAAEPVQRDQRPQVGEATAGIRFALDKLERQVSCTSVRGVTALGERLVMLGGRCATY